MLSKIPEEDVGILLRREESQFFDFKAQEISPASLSKTISALANVAGGEIMVGIDEIKADGQKTRQWRGFPDQEAANPVFSIIENLGGQNVCNYSLLSADGQSGTYST